MNILLRLEEEKDFRETETLTREAFWDIYHPGCTEHLVLHKLRSHADFISSLDFVAVDHEKIVGNIVYSRAYILDHQMQRHEVITFGPLSVAPEYQKKGIGKMLVEHTLALARDMGFKAVIIFGNPRYYNRFGFVNAEKYCITTSEGLNFDAFMALELFPNSLMGISGKYFQSDVFEVGEEELNLFERNFPFKEKHITDTQLK